MKAAIRRIIAVAAMLAAAVWAADRVSSQVMPPQGGQVQKTESPGKPAGSQPSLMAVDPLIFEGLGRIERHLGKGDYKEAFRILDSMLASQGVFYPLPDGRSHVSIRVKINEMIGGLPPEGLKLYRTIYDPKAEQLYREAMESPFKAPVLLQTVADNYSHTSWGIRSLLSLAAIHMDKGRFIPAAQCLNRALKSLSGDPGEPLTLAKLAVASHLGGDPRAAGDAFDRLRNGYPQAAAELGGKQRKLTDFVGEALSRPVPQARSRDASAHDWFGFGAVPDGIAMMDDCPDVSLRPAWRMPQDDPRLPLFQQLCVNLEKYQLFGYLGILHPVNDMGIVCGQVTLGLTGGKEQGSQYINMPPPIHPLVIDDAVIYRDARSVRAVDLFTGLEKWRNTGCPLEKIDGFASPTLPIADFGRMALTAGGGMVFVTCDYQALPRSSITAMMKTVPESKTGLSCLAALSLRDGGRQVWKVGGGQGDDEAIRGGKMLCAPAYHDGRLYVVSNNMDRYFLICLCADTGRFVWKMELSLLPPLEGGNYRLNIPDAGTPPAVADGRVVAVTNNGVIAAVNAESGQPLWAYQYDSEVRMQKADQAGRGYNAGNPIIVAKGRIICLPDDATNIVALNLDDGRPFWKGENRIPRGGFTELSAVDADRFLLSGGDKLAVYSAADGEKLFEWTAPKGKLLWPIAGRPAVAADSVLVSGEGVLYRLNLRDYSVSAAGMADPEGLLGNLVAAGGSLVAANAAGVCAYFNYEHARGYLTKRLKDAAEDKIFDWLYRRACLALANAKYSDALSDCRQMRQIADGTAGQAEKKSRLDQLAPRFYRTYVGLANTADSPAAMVELFRQAGDYAVTGRDRGQLLLRLARACEKAGQFGQAANYMQVLFEKYPLEELADVKIGPEAQTAPARQEQSVHGRGAELARTMLDSLIRNHGQDVYAEMDRRAREVLDKARQENSLRGIESVAKQWPFSRHVDEARLAAAEMQMNQAVGLEGAAAARALGDAIRNLWPVAARQDGPQREKAVTALSLVYARMGQDGAVEACGISRKPIPDRTEVAFADMKGPLGGVLKDIQAGKIRSFTNLPAVCDVLPPLSKMFTLPGGNTFLLRDQDGRPVMLGESVFAIVADPQRDCHIVLADLSAGGAGRSELFKCLYDIGDKRAFYDFTGEPRNKLVGGLSPDNKLLAVADRAQVAVYDLPASALKWRKTHAELGIKTLDMIACGSGNILIAETDGKITCVRMGSGGETAWSDYMLKKPVHRIIFSGGIAAAIDGGRNEMGIFDLEGGRLLGGFRSQDPHSYSAVPIGPGRLAAVADKKLSIFSLEKAEGGNKLTNRDLTPVAAKQTLIAANQDFAVLGLALSAHSPQILAIVKLSDPSPIDPVKLPLGRSKYIISAALSGNDLYVLAAEGFGMQPSSRTLTYNLLNLHKIDLKNGKTAWAAPLCRSENDTNVATRPFSTLAALPQFVCSPIAAGMSHLAFAARQIENVPAWTPEICFIVDNQTGKVSQELLIGRTAQADDKAVPKRWSHAMPPAMNNGRLAMDGPDGLDVYGGQ